MINNEEADYIIDWYKYYQDLKNNNNITDFSMKWKVDEYRLDLYIVPKQVIKHINIGFIITPSGATFQ